MSYSINFDSEKLEQKYSDFVIIGSGIAGLNAAYLAKSFGNVCLITKGRLEDSNSVLAQGGVACVVSDLDCFESHIKDTLYAGVGLCDEDAVEILVKEAPINLKRLIDLGVEFDKKNGTFELGKEGAHSHNRILHAGDYTGRMIIEGLLKAIEGIDVHENTLIHDILVSDNTVRGVLVKNEILDKLYIIWAKVVILATGGAGNLFLNTTNPTIATGDGLAIGARQGAVLKDMEFMQFHPTVLYDKAGERFLISEAVRGEGGILRNQKGERFMLKYHKLKELAPRDVVARAILNEIKNSDIPYVYLDVTSIGKDIFKERFPSIYNKCCKMGIDIGKDYIPVSPAAHYYMGGIMTDINGETSINRLYACGECACTGVQGANRLASNSLLEGLVFSTRAVYDAKKYLYEEIEPLHFYNDSKIDKQLDVESIKYELKCLMEQNAGIIRSDKSLRSMFHWFTLHRDILNINADNREKSELLNLYTVSKYMVMAAILRKESRGSHFRSDFPEKSDKYRKHILIKGDELYFDRQIDSTKINR
ncbi:L-aspartate oxidase [Thermoanaerobacterium sp. RBIITD]|uniref:L-aspartate oxidase n=1 Tax=Thermoanaerobacterium sp. RBIITD TaxID=1550240 RepID=UPI000BB73654|nr:L-aspartate oxidase [Thermoanaerobacterium sp. RBIITD]SNX54528.1 L-aspartate oxidase [Thermoanaerobacterium sp. RBIITD]